MQIAQLQGLVEIARAGSIGRAAEQLFITQPALTARLKALEEELDCALVVRGRGGSRLTDAGRALLPFAERAIAAMDEGAQRARELASGRSGAIAIGAAPAVSAYVLPQILRRLRAKHPDAQLSVRSGHSEGAPRSGPSWRGAGRDHAAGPPSGRHRHAALRGRARSGDAPRSPLHAAPPSPDAGSCGGSSW